MILDNCLCLDGYRSIYGSDAVNEHFYSFFAEKFNANIGKRLRSDTASWNESTGEGAVINTVRTTAQIVRPAFERQSPQASLRAHMDQKRRLRGKSKSLSGPIEHRLQYCPGKSHKVGAEQEDRRRPQDKWAPSEHVER